MRSDGNLFEKSLNQVRAAFVGSPREQGKDRVEQIQNISRLIAEKYVEQFDK